VPFGGVLGSAVPAVATGSARLGPRAMGPARAGSRCGRRRCGRSGCTGGRCADARCRRAERAARTERTGRSEVERGQARGDAGGSATRPTRAKGSERSGRSRVEDAGQPGRNSRGDRGGARLADRSGDGDRAHDGRRHEKMGSLEHGVASCRIVGPSDCRPDLLPLHVGVPPASARTGRGDRNRWTGRTPLPQEKALGSRVIRRTDQENQVALRSADLAA
jgi:hypothetical protein